MISKSKEYLLAFTLALIIACLTACTGGADLDNHHDNGVIIISEEYEELIKIILTEDIKFKTPLQTHVFEVDQDYFIEAASNQVLVSYSTETSEGDLDKLLAFASKYNAKIVGNKTSSRNILFELENNHVLIFIADLEGIPSVTGHLNLSLELESQ